MPDATREYMDHLIARLSENMDSNEYKFIVSDKEIRAIDRDELLRALQK